MRNPRPLAMVSALLLVVAAVFAASPVASAQNTDEIVRELREFGYYIESGADATDSEMRSLVAQADRTPDQWYFVVLSGPADFEYAATLRDEVGGNVIVHSVEEDSQGLFDSVDFATGSTGDNEERALAAFDGDWDRPADYLDDVVADFTALTSTTSAGTSSSGTSSSDTSSSGGGFPWVLVGIPVALGGGFWFLSRRGKKKKAASALETAQKIRAELQDEIDELANDVLVLSGPIDVAEKPEATQYYREATDTYLTISDEIPDVDELEHADLAELSKIAVRVTNARWQMDAAEAILDGEPVPEKPKVEPPPPPTPVEPRTIEQQRQRLPQHQPRPRMPYSQTRRRSGGGLLDILIAGGGMMASTRRRGGLPRGSSIAGTSNRSSTPRPGGGVFGGSQARTTSRSSRSTSRSTSRSSSNRSGGRRSTSKRRRR